MPSQENIEYRYIDNGPALVDAVQRLAGAEFLAIDTEFIGEKYYFPKLEILQISGGGEVYLLDVPALRDTSSLNELIADPRRLKIVHAGDQDIYILHRLTGRPPVPIFDTQVAASLLGFGMQISLANLIRSALGKRVSTKQSTSDWSHRPLSEDQLHYAAGDVFYLHDLHVELRRMLEEHNRLSWFEDEQRERLSSILEPAEQTADEDIYRRVKDWMSLNPRELSVLRELTIWRENEARQKDMPRRAVVTDEGLIELARFQPETREKAKKLRRVNVGQILRYFDELSRCVKRGAQRPPEEWPKKPVPERPDIPIGLIEICQALVRSEAERNQVAPTVVATSADLQRLIVQRNSLGENTIPLLHGWRREVVGEKLIELLQGRLAVHVSSDGTLVFENRR